MDFHYTILREGSNQLCVYLCQHVDVSQLELTHVGINNIVLKVQCLPTNTEEMYTELLRFFLSKLIFEAIAPTVYILEK